MMPCTERTPCAGILYEDKRFHRDALEADMDLWRYSCMNGHSYYYGVESARRGWAAREHSIGTRICPQCDQRVPEGLSKHPACARKEKHSQYYGLCGLCLFPMKTMKHSGGGALYHDSCKLKLPREGR